MKSEDTGSSSYRSQAVVPHPSNKSELPTLKYASLLGSFFLVMLTLLVGVVYVFEQWLKTGQIKDAIFVSMLVGATMILVQGIRNLYKYILERGLDFYAFVTPADDPEKGVREYNQLFRSVFNSKGMTLSGILYGLAIGCAPFALGAWNNAIVLRWLLASFLFTVNFVTGIAFYGLAMFFFHSIKMGQILKVELWQHENPSTAFLMGATRRISILSSLYICICISSILFSLLPIGALIIAYCVFSGLVILASLLVPIFPIVKKMNTAKRNALSEINEQLQNEFRKIVGKVNRSKDNVDLKQIESLLSLREKIDAVSVWPFKLKTVGAAASVIFVSSIPVILQFMLEKLAR